MIDGHSLHWGCWDHISKEHGDKEIFSAKCPERGRLPVCLQQPPAPTACPWTGSLRIARDARSQFSLQAPTLCLTRLMKLSGCRPWKAVRSESFHIFVIKSLLWKPRRCTRAPSQGIINSGKDHQATFTAWNWVILGESLNFSLPQLPPVYIRDNDITFLVGILGRLNEVVHNKQSTNISFCYISFFWEPIIVFCPQALP